MASGFPGGGSDLFSGRSMNPNPQTNNPYRTQLSQIFLDSSSQIAQYQQQQRLHHSPVASYIGKRTLSDYQTSQHHLYQQQQNQGSSLNPFNALLARSVKPRIYQNSNTTTTTSPISTLSPIEFSANNNFSPELPAASQHQQQQQRYGFPLLQQLRPQPINIGHNNNGTQIQTLQGIPFANSVQSAQPSQMSQSNRGVVAASASAPTAAGGGSQESEKKMMNRLQELEKQLLDDDSEDDEGCGGDAVSGITNTNSEWSETIQNLISPSSSSSPTTTNNHNNNNNNPISPSPSPSSSSSNSSTTTSAATTPAICTRPVLMEAAAAIYEGRSDSAAEILSRVGSSGGKGNSKQRLMDYLFSALKSRVNPADNPPPVGELYEKEHMKNGFHVVDFDIGQGGQYMNLLYAMAERLNGSPAVVKITAVPDGSGGEEERARLNSVGNSLRQLAEGLGVTLHFNVAAAASCRLSDLSRESLGCEPDEPLAVNFAFKLFRMPDESVSTENPRDELLRRVRAMEPRVVTVVEQEMNRNTAPFLARVSEAFGYYGALLDSIGATVQGEAERGRVEEGLGRKLANAVACEGRDRVERCEVFGKWRARMGMAGFRPKPLSQAVTELMRARLNSANRAIPGFTVKEDNGGACFGWMGKSLTVASAWR
ncbi:unnamed protein product [Linum trigynum]|uniref:Scarecrow-like protein 8 n=1 Tax=Linum trigynum TaxID=586398 RepID=A0AAV2DCA5_9ROSI